MEYLRCDSRGCDPPVPVRGSPSKLRAAVENAPLSYEEYEPQLLQYQVQQQHQQQQHQHFQRQQQQMSQANTSNHISNSTYSDAIQSRVLNPSNNTSDNHRSWVETALLPSVISTKAPSRVIDQNIKTAPSSSSNRIEIKPRAKSAAAVRRPGQSLPSSNYTSREKEHRQSNPAIIFSRPSSGNDHVQNSKNRDASADDYLGATSWSGARVSSANGTRKNIPISKNASKSKLSESMIFTPNRRVYDQNRVQKESKRTSPCSNLTPVASKESERDEKLAFMYGDDVINRLDSVVVIRYDNMKSRIHFVIHLFVSTAMICPITPLHSIHSRFSSFFLPYLLIDQIGWHRPDQSKT